MEITGDPRLGSLYDELTGYPGVEVAAPQTEVRPSDIVLELKLRDPDGSGVLAFFSTLSTFGTAVDITLSELAIEAFYPANAQTAARLLSAVGH